MIEIIGFIAFGFVLLIIILVRYLKDKEISAKFAKYEKILDILMKENHAIKKELKNTENIDIADKSADSLDNLQEKLELKIQADINAKIVPILSSITNIENVIKNFQEQQQDRIYDLEERTKSISKITPPSQASEEERVLYLFQNGTSAEDIARDMQLSVGKVNLILKIHGLRS